MGLYYGSSLLGTIAQTLQGLQGYEAMALELIQNADDAKAKRICFDVTDDALVITNDQLFTNCRGLEEKACVWKIKGNEGRHAECNFHAIADIGARSKAHHPDQIGRFGIGFVSVFQVTDTPTIQSGDTGITIDPLNVDVDLRSISYLDGSKFVLPWVREYTPTRREIKASQVPDDVCDQVVSAVGQVSAEALLFLRRLEEIELRRNGETVFRTRITRSGNRATVTQSPSEASQDWLLLEKDGEDAAAPLLEKYQALQDAGRATRVQIAFPIGLDKHTGRLFAFLPTAQPSTLPCHINADFFPVQTRKEIILDGTHQRAWNVMLLGVAAQAIAEALNDVKNDLGAEGIWSLIEQAHMTMHNRDLSAFHVFWKRLLAIKGEPLVLTIDGDWQAAAECVLPPALGDEQEATLAEIGFRLVSRELRRYHNALAAMGGTRLILPKFISGLADWAERAELSPGSPSEELRRVWRLVDDMIAGVEYPRDKPSVARLNGIRFILGIDDGLASLSEVYRHPRGAPIGRVSKLVPQVRFIHGEVRKFHHLYDLARRFSGLEFASELALQIPDAQSASDYFAGEHALGELYQVLPALAWADGEPDKDVAGALRKRLGGVPFLRPKTGFVSPSRALLPGGFVDPVGHLEILDTAPIDEKMHRFLRDVLKVEVLSFERYVEEHLEGILGLNLDNRAYQALLAEMVKNRGLLGDHDLLAWLGELELLRVRDGTFKAASEVYSWSAEVEKLLGLDEARFIDLEWLPGGKLDGTTRDFLTDIGVQEEVAMSHLVERVEELVASPPDGQVRESVRGIVRHIVQRFPRLEQSDRRDLEGLKRLTWIPVTLDGEPDTEAWRRTAEVYQPYRATGFSSQVPIVDFPSRQHLPPLFEFFGIKSEPSTSDVVAHLEHCIEHDIKPNDTVYQILSARLEKGDDVAAIERLGDEPFIYADEVGFLHAHDVFWDRALANFGWYRASSSMRQRAALFEHLGVVGEPTAVHYARFLQSLCAQGGDEGPTEAEYVAHSIALSALGRSVIENKPDADEALALLENDPFLLARDGSFVHPAEAVWLDSEYHASFFGDELDGLLVVRPSGADALEATMLFKRLGVPSLRELTQLKLEHARDADLAIEETAALNERADLLLWIPTDGEFRSELSKMLGKAQIFRASELAVAAECHISKPPVGSPLRSVEAFYDEATHRLYAAAVPDERFKWSKAFLALFAPIRGSNQDSRLYVMAAQNIMRAPYRESALEELLESGFSEPHFTDDIDVQAGELSDFNSGEAETPDATSPIDDEAHKGDSDFEIHEDDSGTRVGRPGGNGTGANTPLTAIGGNPDNASDEREGPVDPEGRNPGFKIAMPRRANSGQPSDDEVVRRPAGTEPESQEKSRTSPSRSSTHRGGRLHSYVSPVADGPAEPGTSPRKHMDDVDQAAMRAVLAYEERAGRTPERQVHSNPGFDIYSVHDDGNKRIIEVKGTAGEWNEAGVGLSAVQFAMAQRHLDNYWLYVVEHALSDDCRVHAIRNPFDKIERFFFDHGWRSMAEETMSRKQAQTRVGAKVRYPAFGIGTITEVVKSGFAVSLKVNFGSVNGTKLISMNDHVQFID